jgi:hypothetical protein
MVYVAPFRVSFAVPQNRTPATDDQHGRNVPTTDEV